MHSGTSKNENVNIPNTTERKTKPTTHGSRIRTKAFSMADVRYTEWTDTANVNILLKNGGSSKMPHLNVSIFYR